MSNTRRCAVRAREQAVAWLSARRSEYGNNTAAITSTAGKLRMNTETPHASVRRTEVDRGSQPGTTTSGAKRIRALERQNKDPRRENDILGGTSAFFERELNPTTTEEMSAVVDALRDEHRVEPTCMLPQLAPSSCYAVSAAQRSPSKRALRDRKPLDATRRAHTASLEAHGARKAWRQLRREGAAVTRRTAENQGGAELLTESFDRIRHIRPFETGMGGSHDAK